MSKKQEKSLIQRLIDNEISKEEFDELLSEMEDEKARELHEQYLKAHFDQIMGEYESFPELEEEAIGADASDKKMPVPTATGKIFIINNTLFKIAASILLAALSFATFWIIVRQNDEDSLIVQSEQSIEPAFEEKATPKGAMDAFVLEDGSKGQLNVNSKIKYPEKFASDSREVILDGQAYFDVQPDKTRPFTITAKNIMVEVVGTSFDINAYENESKISITVESGKVKVHNVQQDGSPVVLTRNQKLIYDSETSSFSLTEVESSDEMAWRHGVLSFNKTPVAEVERMLERWYNVEMNIMDTAIYQQKITGVHKNESLLSVLRTLNYVLDVNHKIEGNTVTLKKNK